MKRKIKIYFLTVFLTFLTFLGIAGIAIAAPLYVDDNSICDSYIPCYSHPQDAVNDASAGDTIIVYPGTYGSRQYTTAPPHWSSNDKWAPALIVYKDNLTIQAVDTNPANTVIQTTHNLWSNPVAIQASTGGTWDGSQYVGAGVNPTGGTSPNGVIVIANGVIIEGFTIISTYGGDSGDPGANPNTAGVFIGGLFAGDRDRYGISGTTVRNCILSGHSGVRLWKAPDTTLEGNTIDNYQTLVSPGTTPVGAGIMVWDGWCDNPSYPVGGGWCEGPNVGSAGLQIIDNDVTTYFSAQGISLGGYYDDDGDALMDQSNLFIHDNTIDSTGHGVTFWGSGGINKFMTCINTVLVPSGYDQVANWWGTYDGPFGIDCDDQFVTGGGWIDSPPGAFKVPASIEYGDLTLNVPWWNTSFPETWDLTACDLNVSYGLDMSQMATGPIPIQVGLKEPGAGNIDPNSQGGWMQANPQKAGSTDPSSLDDDDHFLLVDHGWLSDELKYDVDPLGNIVPQFGTYDTAAFWFDRDGVDATQATQWDMSQNGTAYNTGGQYSVAVDYSYSSSDNKGTMFATINGGQQGIYTSGWKNAQPEIFPAGKSFGLLSGDFSQLKLFVGAGPVSGQTQITDLTVTGCGDVITGKASFAFISKYKKGATEPSGQTIFIFKAGDLNFHSDSYDFLVVTGGNYAKFKGTGTINGEGSYKFMLWAGDGDPDTFRIKIWEEDEFGNENVIYDNGIVQSIAGGSIVVHTKKN
jgi:hypothetical protein